MGQCGPIAPASADIEESGNDDLKQSINYDVACMLCSYLHIPINSLGFLSSVNSWSYRLWHCASAENVVLN